MQNIGHMLSKTSELHKAEAPEQAEKDGDNDTREEGRRGVEDDEQRQDLSASYLSGADALYY